MSNVRPQRTPFVWHFAAGCPSRRHRAPAQVLTARVQSSPARGVASAQCHAKALVLLRARTSVRTARPRRSTGALRLLGEVVTHAAPPSSTAASPLEGRSGLAPFAQGAYGQLPIPCSRGSRPLQWRMPYTPATPWPNPSIERTFQRPLRALWPAAHVER